MKEISIITNSEEETIRVGSRMGQSLQRGLPVAIIGPLGAGKTVLIRGLCRGLGYGGEVTSPSYNIMNVYSGAVRVFHFDLYRLDKASDMEDLGFEEQFFDEKCVALVEWADRALGTFPNNSLHIRIEILGESKRRILVSTVGQLQAQANERD